MSEKDFVFDLNRLSYDEFMDFYGDAGEEGPEMSEEEGKKLMAKILVEWPLEAEITPENIGKMGILDFKKMQDKFSSEMENMFEDSKN